MVDRTLHIGLLLALTVLVAGPVSAPAVAEAPADPVVYRVVAGESQVGFHASSTLHGFEGSSAKVTGEIRFSPADPADDPVARVELETASLDTGIGARNRKMWRLLEADRHPAIRFDLQRVSDVRIDPAAGTIRARAGGTMTIRGQERPLSLDVQLEPLSGGRFKVTGSAPLDMTRYGIKPPRVMFMKVAPEVTLNIALVLEPAPAEADSP